MLSGGNHGEASPGLSVEVQQTHDSSTIVSFPASTAAAAAPRIMDQVVKQHPYQHQQHQKQKQLAREVNDEKKEDCSYPYNHYHHHLHHDGFASLPSVKDDSPHHAFATSILSTCSVPMEGEEEEEVDDEEHKDEDDAMISNFVHTAPNGASSSPPGSINMQAKKNISPSNNRITLNTHNSILSMSEDEDEDGDNTTPVIHTATTISLPRNNVKDSLPKQEGLPLHYSLQRSSPSSCLMDNDDDEDDDSYDDNDGDDDEQRDGSSFSSRDLGEDVQDFMTTSRGSHHGAEKADECISTKNHLPFSSLSIENDRSSSPPAHARAETPLASYATPTTPSRPRKATSSSDLPQTPPNCTRSWCVEATTTTSTTTPAAEVMVVTSPLLLATSLPSIPIPQELPSAAFEAAATTDGASQPPLLPPYGSNATTTTTTSHVLMKSPRGGRGFLCVMTDHFVDSLCFPRDGNLTSAGVATATTAAAPPHSQSPTQEPWSTPRDGGAGSTATALQTARDLTVSTATSDVAAADPGASSAANPPKMSHAVSSGNGSTTTSSSCWTSPLFGTSANSDQRSLCLQDDITVLLGCANNPNDDEMQKVWSWNQSILECPRKASSDDDDLLFHSQAVTCGNASLQYYDPLHHREQHEYHVGRRRPRRRELHERALRVHQLRIERGMPCYNKKPFSMRMKQMLFAPHSSTATKTTSAGSTTTTSSSSSPTSVTADIDPIEGSSSAKQHQHQETTYYGNLPVMMDESNLLATEYHIAHCSTRCVGTDDNTMKTSLPLRRSSRSMDDRILQQECKNDPLRKSKLEESLNRRIGIGKNGNSTTGTCARASPMYYQNEEEDMGYDSDPGGLDAAASSTCDTTATHSAAILKQHTIMQHNTPQQRMETASALSTSNNSSFNSLLGQPTIPLQPHWDANVIETVQESLNMSWNLTWHPGNNVDANGGNNNNSRKILIWIERGTIVNSAKVMLEPNLMWRDCYQPELSKQRKLNVCMPQSSQTQPGSTSSTTPTPSAVKPSTIRLLSICRVREAPLNDALDRSLYPLARPSCSFLLKTAAPDGKEYLFEAATTAERDVIVHRWKICIARFAALAVMEDLDAICREFFVPSSTSRMLVPDDYCHW